MNKMENNSICNRLIKFIFINLLLFSYTTSYSQIDYLGGVPYVCPGSEVEYWTPAISPDCTIDKIIWLATNGTIIQRNPESVVVRWNSNIITGQLKATMIVMGNDCGVTGNLKPLDVTGIYIDNLDVLYLDENNTELPSAAMNGGKTYLLQENIKYTSAYEDNSPDITWSIYLDADTKITDIDGTGATINFRPYDYYNDLANYFSKEEFSEGIVVQIRATLNLCGHEEIRQETLTIIPEPIIEIQSSENPPTCLNSTNGELIINSFEMDGTIYNSSNYVSGMAFINVVKLDNSDQVVGAPVVVPTPITQLPFTINTIASSSTILLDGAVTYAFTIERSLDGTTPSGIYDDYHNFTIPDGPTIELILDKTSRTCYESSLIVNAKVNDEDLSGYKFYGADGENGTGNSFNYNILPSSGTYNLYAEITNVPACTTATVEFVNPNKISISSPTITPPAYCYDTDGTTNTEFGKVIVTASNYQSGLSFTFEKYNEVSGQYEGYTPSGSITSGTGNYNVMPGIYTITATHTTCTNESAQTSATISALKRPIVSSGDISVTNPTCPNSQGGITLNKFSYDGNNFSSTSNLSNFKFYNGVSTTAFSEVTNKPDFFNFTASPASSTTYYFKIVSDTRCPVQYNENLIYRSKVTLNTPTVKESCLDNNNGIITISSSEGNSASLREYTISPNDSPVNPIQKSDGTAAVFSGLHPNINYTITVNDFCSENNTASISRTVGNFNRPSGSFNATQIECHDQENGKLDVTPSGASGNNPLYTITLLTDNGVISSAEDVQSQTFTGLNHLDNYSVKIEDSNGCIETFHDEIPEIVNPTQLEFVTEPSDIKDVTCWQGSDGIISASVTGGTGQIDFSIDGVNFNAGTDDGLSYIYNFQDLSEGEYHIAIHDAYNCPLETTYTIDQPAEYKVSSLTTDGAKCFGGSDGSLSVAATGGTPTGLDYTYNLMDVNDNIIDSKTGPSANFTGRSFGNYYVNIIDSRECPLTSALIELSQPEEMLITKNMSAISCYSTTDITLSADITGGTEPYSYTWKDEHKNFYSSASSIKVDKGNYFLFVMDAHNCGYGKTAPDLEQPFSVDYTVDKPDTIKVTIDNLQNVDYNGLSNGSITLSSSGGWSFHQYSMDGGEYQNLPEFTGLEIGPHTFRVKDGSNCENSITATITQPDPFSVNLKSIKDVNCFDGTDGQITIHAQGGISPYNFVLDDGQGNVIEQNDSVFVGLPAGNYSASVGYRTYNQLVNNIAIGQPASALSSGITAYQSPKCTFSDGWATVTANGGTSPYTYSWSNLQTASTATTLHSGDYYVVTSDFNNCTDTSTITLYDIAGPELSIGQINDLPCSNSDNVGSITLSVSGGTVPYNVQWNDPDHQTGLTASGLASGTYSATVTDFDGCISKSEDILITRPTELIINFDGFKDPACFGETNGEITASATGGTPPYQFVWQGIGNAGNTGIVSGLPAGVYDLNLTDAHNCVTQGNFELKNPDEIVINLPDSVFICAGQTATLDAGNLGSFFQWTADNGFSSDKQIVNLPEQGDYTVTVSNVEGCSNSKKVHLKYENRQFDAAFLLASQATMADTVVLIEISWPVPDSLEWNITDDFLRLVDGGAYKELIPLETGEYTVGMRAWLAGCEDIVEKTITIVPADGQKELKVSKVDLIQSAKLFPNPNTGNFEVEVKLAYEADVRADLFSIKGLRIIPTKYDSGKKDYLIGFNLMRLEPGVYFVNVSAGDEVRKLKFVVN